MLLGVKGMLGSFILGYMIAVEILLHDHAAVIDPRNDINGSKTKIMSCLH